MKCPGTYQFTEFMRNGKIIFRMEEQNRDCNTGYAINKQIHVKITIIARVPRSKFSSQYQGRVCKTYCSSVLKWRPILSKALTMAQSNQGRNLNNWKRNIVNHERAMHINCKCLILWEKSIPFSSFVWILIPHINLLIGIFNIWQVLGGTENELRHFHLQN